MPIEVVIRSEATGGLKIIERIPDVRPCRLEGKNGIGKSMAIRILALASGEQPYSTDAGAWLSFKEHVGESTVELSGLDVGTATLTLTPQDWPDEPGYGPGDRLGRLEINGVSAPASELFPLLDVVHLIGTEGLAETLLRRNQSYAVALRAVKARLETLGPQRAEIESLATKLAAVSPLSAKADHEERTELKRKKGEDEEAHAKAYERLTALKKAADFHAMLSSAELSERTRELDEATARVGLVTTFASEREKAVDDSIAALDKGSKAQKEIAAEERKLTTLKKKREKQLATLPALVARTSLQTLDLSEQLPAAGIKQLEKEAREARSRYLEKAAALRRAEMTDAQRTLHTQLRIVLEEGIRAGLGTFPILRLSQNPITVAELVAGIDAPPAAGTVKSEEVQAAETTALDLEAMLEIHRAESQYQADLMKIGQTLTALRKAAPEQDELQSAVTSARDAYDSVAHELRQLRQRIGFLQAHSLPQSEVEAATKTVAETLTVEGISEEELAPRLDELTLETATLRQQIEEANKGLGEITARESQREIERHTLDPAMSQSAPADWLAALGGGPLAEAADRDTWWQRAADRAAHFHALFNSLLTEVSGLEFAAQNPSVLGRHSDVISSLVEDQALGDLSVPAITEALFDSGKPTKVDLKSKMISWTTSAGVLREKPLSAFSSGEAALGFMRATLRQIAEQPTRNRIVFLDEFGAFVSADRRHPLTELLTSKQLKGLSDEIVIVLPLQSDYAAQIKETTGALKIQYQNRAAQIEADGYFAEKFDE